MDPRRDALRLFGFSKVADEEPEESHTLRNSAMGAAAVSPFMGMIGQKRVLHDPHTNTNIARGSHAQLMSAARPGDVFVYADRDGSVWRTAGRATGSDFFHTMPVVQGRGASAKNIISGEFDHDPALRARMQQGGQSAVSKNLDSLKKSFKEVGNPDMVLLRPKQPLTPQQQKAFAAQAMERGAQKYSPSKGVSAFLHELFMPKVFGGGGKPAPVCEGDMCSTLVSESMNSAGRKVVDNKASRHVMPVDLLRSEQYAPVMARVQGKAPGRFARAMPWVARAGIGAGLAGATYAASENPALAAVPLGMAAGSALGNVAMRAVTGHGAPSTLGLISRLGNASGAERLKMLGRFGASRGIGMALGGGAAYMGAKAIQDRWAQPKTAADDEEEGRSNLGRNLGVGALAASPFMGMIGEKKIIHDPHLNKDIKRYDSIGDLGRVAQPGDVVMTSKRQGSLWKRLIQPLSGSEFYHSQPVVDRRGGSARTLSAGEYTHKSFADHSTRDIRKGLESLPDLAKRENYQDMVVLRPKKPLTEAEMKIFRDEALARSRTKYDFGGAVKSWLHDAFVPKFEGLGGKSRPRCDGDICSTLPAEALNAVGRKVGVGKAPGRAFPTDFLRSENFQAVGAVTNGKGKSDLYRRAAPIATRAALGLGLAGAGYAAYENPTLAAAPVGAAAGAYAANRMFGNKARPMLDLLTDLGKGKARMRAMGQIGGKVLGTAAGGAAAYYGTKALVNRARPNEQVA